MAKKPPIQVNKFDTKPKITDWSAAGIKDATRRLIAYKQQQSNERHARWYEEDHPKVKVDERPLRKPQVASDVTKIAKPINMKYQPIQTSAPATKAQSTVIKKPTNPKIEMPAMPEKKAPANVSRIKNTTIKRSY
jgi:hypothetical protein